MSIPADLSMRYAIYTFEKQYTRWGAVFPGNFVPVLISEGKCLYWRARPAHLEGHLPIVPIQTLAIRTSNPDPTHAPDLKQVQTYQVYHLEGTDSFFYFE